MPMTGKEMLKLYLKNGWTLAHVTGSHHIVTEVLNDCISSKVYKSG